MSRLDGDVAPRDPQVKSRARLPRETCTLAVTS